MKSLPTRRLAALILAAPLALTACSSGGTTSPSSSTSAATSTASLGDLKPGQQVDKAAFFKVTQAASDANKTYAFQVQVGQDGSVSSSSGVADNRDDKDRKRQLSLRDATGAEKQLVIAGGKIYERMGANGPWTVGPLSSRFEQNLGGAQQRVADDQDIAKDITYVGEEDVQGVKTRHFTVTIDPAKASQSASSGAATTPAATTPAATTPAGTATTTAGGADKIDYWLDDQNRTRKMTHVVGGLPTSTIYDRWGENVTIDVPTGDQVTTSPATGATPATATTPAAAPTTSAG